MICCRSVCKASVLLEIDDFMLPNYIRDKSKRPSAASILNLDNLITKKHSYLSVKSLTICLYGFMLVVKSRIIMALKRTQKRFKCG